MPIRARLFAEGYSWDILNTEYLYHKWMTPNGLPDSLLLGGRIEICIAADKQAPFFFAWVLHQVMKHGYIRFYDRYGGKEFDLFFYDCYCIHFSERFRYNENPSLVLTLVLSPGIQKLRDQLFLKPWYQSNPENLPPVTQEEIEAFMKASEPEPEKEKEKEKKCRLVFKADKNQAAQGAFGWDAMLTKYKRIADNYERLKQEYTPLTVWDREYFVPWLSLREGQTVTLNLKKKTKGEHEKITLSWEGAPGNAFTITPDNLKEADSVQISCNTALTQPVQLKVLADGELAGALNIWQNRVKKVQIRWVFVEIEGNGEDEKELNRKITRQKLEQYLKKSFAPALLEIEIINKDADIADINEYTAELKKRGVLKKHSDKDIGEYIERSKVNQVFSAIKLKDTSHSETIVSLYFINRKCIISKEINETGPYKMTGGISPVGDTGIAYMVLDDDKQFRPENIVHEVMHGLGLPHSFKDANSNVEGAHTFKQGRTTNYMDYENPKKYTCKWQWELLHKSKHTK